MASSSPPRRAAQAPGEVDSAAQAPDEAAGGGAGSTRFEGSFVVAAVFAALLVVALAAVDYLPTQDGPSAIFMGWLENHYTDANTHYRAFLRAGNPSTGLGFHLTFASIVALLPWRTALRVTLAMTGVLFGSCYFWLVRTLHPRRWTVGLLGFALAPQWALYMGWFSFTLATGLSFAVLAMALTGWPWSSDRRFVIALLLALVGVAQLTAAVMLWGVLLSLVLARAERGRRVREGWWLLLMAAPLLGIAWVTIDAAWVRQFSHTAATPLRDRLWMWVRGFASGPLWRGGVVAVMALVGTGSAWRAGRGAHERGLSLAATALLLLGLVLPLRTATGQFVAPWVLPLGFMLALALLPIERVLSGAGRLVQGVVVVFALASLGWAGWYHVGLRRGAEGYLAGLDAQLARTGPRGVVVWDAGASASTSRQWVPFSRPARHIGQLYAVAQGGIPMGLPAGRPNVAPFLLSRVGQRRFPHGLDATDEWLAHAAAALAPTAIDPAQRKRRLRAVAYGGSAFEDLLIVGAPDDWAPLGKVGYRTDFENEHMFIGTFVGCEVTLRVLGPAQRIRFFQGWQSLSTAARERVAAVRGNPPYALRIAGLPCNGAWLQLAVQRADGLYRCAEADERGVIEVVPNEDGSTVVACSPR